MLQFSFPRGVTYEVRPFHSATLDGATAAGGRGASLVIQLGCVSRKGRVRINCGAVRLQIAQAHMLLSWDCPQHIMPGVLHCMF